MTVSPSVDGNMALAERPENGNDGKTSFLDLA
jgi:hypothetical protein